ncbi:MAG: glycosyltransferase family 39 protein [Planctomycetaceae bacterium]|nr:glycosyltransferase family 39 protein [Planctomycetaceae bacterium]
MNEAQRYALAQPVYADPAGKHATHMYGPLATPLIGTMFRITGPSFLPARIMSLVSLTLLILLVLAIAAPRRARLTATIALTLMVLSAHAVADGVEPRPDCSSLLLATLALVVMYHASQRASWLLWFSAALLTTFAMLLKQPTVMVAAVPLLQTVTAGRLGHPLTHWLQRSVPLVTAFLTIALTAVCFPNAFHFSFRVPGQYAIEWKYVSQWSVILLIFLLVLLPAWQALRQTPATDRTMLHPDVRGTWFLSTLLVSVPCCLITASKTGGMMNSLLPAIFSGIALFLHWSQPLEQLLRENGRLQWHSRSLRATRVVLAVLLMAPVVILIPNRPTSVTFGDAGFAAQCERVRLFAGNVGCPQDPALLVLAGRTPQQSLVLEYDAAGWPSSDPMRLVDGWNTWDAFVSVGRRNDWRMWPWTVEDLEEHLQQHGFELSESADFPDSRYRFWIRRHSPVRSTLNSKPLETQQRVQQQDGSTSPGIARCDWTTQPRSQARAGHIAR